ncbi:MAG: GntR family transcriptional regulator [Cyanobacteria bacterium HKST-UBA04]|nr:GntR family transcriptional regulator [Cyanobacteria bacterium HKST-UBA04]MCA9841049.1 GntR family transcriptional regulator [Cyanobacteria bacterium HKST-UBA03]
MAKSSKQTAKTSKKEPTVQKGGGLIKPYLDQASSSASPANDYAVLKKTDLDRIDLSAFPKAKPDFDLPGATKDGLIAQWLMDWIDDGLKKKKLNESMLMPKKADLAKYLGVSVGTVQNAIRFIEDKGYVESKQRIGTVIRNPKADNQKIRKLTSKRDQAVIAIKQFILKRELEVGEALPSARELARIIGSAPNTTRLALEYLSGIGIIENRGARGNKANWFLDAVPELAENEVAGAIESETLIDQVERDLKQLIEDNYDIGDKLPSHLDLAKVLKVSIKTVHDAMCRVNEQGIIQSKRGRYGSYVLRKPSADQLISTEEAASLFVPAKDAAFYNYEKVERHLKGYIAQNTKVGDKLPSMSKLADDLGVSSNTIRKALQQLGEQGYVRFERGRYGGTFVAKVPKVKEDASYAWVSINPESIKSYRKAKSKK